MPTTPTHSWPTPADTDYVKDGAAAIRALADAIDADLSKVTIDALGIDADTVDGLEAAAFALEGHTHSGGGPHIEAATTPGSLYNETVTFAAAFSTVPVVTVTPTTNSYGTEHGAQIMSVSTTSTEVLSYQGTNSTARPKHVIATEATV